MENVTQTVNQLIGHFNTLADRYAELKKQVTALERERDELQHNLEDQTSRVEELQEKVKTLQLTRGRLSDEERTEMKRKINEYVREIDKCIAQLHD